MVKINPLLSYKFSRSILKMVHRWFEEEITEKQLEYIRILSSYEDTWVEDIEDIMSFLIECGKKNLKDLTKEEASKLIQKLLQRPVTYTFPCGEKRKLHKQDVNMINVLGGYFKACLSLCPKGIDIYDCRDFIETRLSEEAEMYPPEPIGKKKLINLVNSYEKCRVCGRIPADNRIYEFIKLEYPHEVNRFFVGTLYEHHTSYEKNETVLVYQSCHVKIHRDPRHPLYPKDKPKLQK
ncbi:hypothetical protein DRO97_09415 [Archaeoglobales archaeon]|nr:MAG: hypothetical protein DRO97_09415 [Archaeoglobales archaeon]